LFHRPSPNPSRDPEHASPVLLIDPMKAGLVNKKKPFSQKNLRQSDDAKEDLSNGEGVSDNERNDTNQNGNGETKTDVLEVWFPGCHTGASIANSATNKFSKQTIQISVVAKSQTQPNIRSAEFLFVG
jgi:hypothetical protein